MQIDVRLTSDFRWQLDTVIGNVVARGGHGSANHFVPLRLQLCSETVDSGFRVLAFWSVFFSDKSPVLCIMIRGGSSIIAHRGQPAWLHGLLPRLCFCSSVVVDERDYGLRLGRVLVWGVLDTLHHGTEGSWCISWKLAAEWGEDVVREDGICEIEACSVPQRLVSSSRSKIIAVMRSIIDQIVEMNASGPDSVALLRKTGALFLGDLECWEGC